MNQKRSIIISLAIALILAAVVRSIVLGAASPPAKPWEYTVMSPTFTEARGRNADLNAMGNEGWELVAVAAYGNGNTYCYLKRPKP